MNYYIKFILIYETYINCHEFIHKLLIYVLIIAPNLIKYHLNPKYLFRILHKVTFSSMSV